MSVLAALTYQDQPVRVLGTPDEPLFVAADCCAVLSIANSRDAVADFESDERDAVVTTDAIGRSQEQLVVTEAGLYRLIFQSRKPAAAAFRRWVWHEVLPALRKTGRYDMHSGQTARVEASDLRSLLERAEPILLREPVDKADVAVLKRGWARLLGETGLHAQIERCARQAAQESPTDLLSWSAVCRRLGVSRWTLKRWIDAWRAKVAAGEAVPPCGHGYWPAPTHGFERGSRWERAVVDRWIESMRSTPQERVQ